MKRIMKAVVVKAPMNFDIEQVPIPFCPPEGILLKVHACGLCGSDLRTLRFGHPDVKFPWIIGHEISGAVVEVGPACRAKWKTGDTLCVGPVVYCGSCEFCINGKFEFCENHREIAQVWPGGFAEYVAIPPESVNFGTIQLVPKNLDPAIAAVAEPISSCIHAQERAQVGLGDTVVVIGVGPIGCVHINLAKVRGADKIIAADINESRLELVKDYEPDYIINAAKTDLVKEVRHLTHGKGADVIVTANPSPVTQIQAVEMAKKAGRILLFGGLPADQACPQVNMNIVHYNALHLIGATTFGPRHYATAVKLLASGRISGEKFLTHRFALTDFKEGVKQAMEGKVRKAVFLP
jgi:L-iditol 2-dehydrogenase